MPATPRRRVRMLALWASLALWATASAQGWTVQTVAVRDLREAELRAQELLELGFDAYTEFVMSQGSQWVRVRVGCYATRAGAELLADTLQGDVTAEAVAVETSENAAPRACVRREIGFRHPDDWQQLAPGAAAFRVEVDGVEALVRLQQGRWQVLQGGALEALPSPGAAETGRFEQADGPDGPWVRFMVDDLALYVCPGRLLAEDGEVAVVEHDGAVMACHLGNGGS